MKPKPIQFNIDFKMGCAIPSPEIYARGEKITVFTDGILQIDQLKGMIESINEGDITIKQISENKYMNGQVRTITIFNDDIIGKIKLAFPDKIKS